MNRRILIFFFILLTIFNIFTLLGIGVNYVASNILFSDEWPPKLMKKYGLRIFSYKADLSGNQIENISIKREHFLVKIIPMRNQLHQKQNELLALLSSDSADKENILKKQNEIQFLQNQIQSEVIQQILNVKDELTPEQRKVFFRMVEKRMGGASPFSAHMQ